MGVSIADPPGLRTGPEQQVLGHGQAQQLGITQGHLRASPAFAGVAEIGQDLVGEEDVECSQEGAEVFVHTMVLTPSAYD